MGYHDLDHSKAETEELKQVWVIPQHSSEFLQLSDLLSALLSLNSELASTLYFPPQVTLTNVLASFLLLPTISLSQSHTCIHLGLER